MRNLEMRHSVKSLIIVVALATAFSSFTLWLIETWIKYPLFLLEVLTIIVLYLIVGGYDIKIIMKQMRVENLNVGLIIDLFIMASALSLLMFNVLQVNGGLVQLALALLCTSLLSGYALLNIFGLTRHFSKLENLLLSYILSYTFTGFITFVSLSINQNVRTIVVLASFIVVGFISAFKHKRSEPSSALESFSKNIDFLALSVVVTFYVISFWFMYPGFALLPGTDISRHYAGSIVLGRTPDIYIGSVYLFFHLHGSMFLSISNPSLVAAQTALVTLNLMLPLAFYVMAKPYLEKIDARLPSLATMFWALFTNSFGGFSWLYFLRQKLSTTGQTQLQLLAAAADKTYNGTIYGILGLWHVPACVSLVLLMASIFLMCKKEIPTTKYLALFSIIIAVQYLTYVTTAVVFALFLAVYGAISRNQNFRTDQAIKSSIVGFLFVIIIYYILSTITARSIINMSLLVSLISPISALLFSLLIRKTIKQKLPSFGTTSRIKNKAFLKTLLLSLLFAYVVAFLSWTSLVDSFRTGQVDAIGLVPWFMYPLMLGINGFLGIIALYYLTRNAKSYEVLALFTAFMIFAFIAGKTVSIVNIYFFDAGYWEKRFIWLIKLPLAALAPIPILLLIDRLHAKNIHVNKAVASVITIGTIVLCGVSTTFLNVEYWNIVATDPACHPSLKEMSAINAFKEMLDSDPRAWLVTVTNTSACMATFAAPPDMLLLRPLLYTAYTPEMAFTQLYRHPAYDHPYIYVHNRDRKELRKFADRFFVKYLSTLPIVFENLEVKIYNASKPSPPQPNSDTALILPFDKGLCSGENLYIAYNMLSQGFCNYTIAYDLGGALFNTKVIILAYDPPSEVFDDFTINYDVKLNLRATEDYINFLESDGKIIILNTNGYNFFANSLFSVTDGTFNAEKIEGLNTTLNLPKRIVMQKLSLKDPAASIISNYLGQDGEAPYIIKRNYGEGELFYVNIYPIADAVRKAENPSAFYPILGKLLDDLNLPKLDKNFLLAIDGYVKAIDLSGNPKAETNSLIFPINLELKQLNIKTTNGTITLYNVTRIHIKCNSNLIIEAENFMIENGEGFYAVLKLNSTFTVKPSTGLLEIKVATENGENQITYIRELSITPLGSVNLLARTPEISASQATFIEFYPSISLRWSTRSYGQNLKVRGLTSFQIVLSDSYTILKNVKLGPSFTLEPPITMFDELSTIPTAIFWTLLLLPVFVGIILVFGTRTNSK